MIDLVRAMLTALRIGPVPSVGDLAVVKLDDHPGVFLGLDDQRRAHLLVDQADGQSVPAPKIATLDVSTRSLVVGQTHHTLIDVGCVFNSVSDVFEHFIAAVLDHMTNDGADPSVALVAVLERWRQFLTPGRQAVGRDKLASVFGELLVVCDVVAADPQRRIESWRGPLAGRHDLRRGMTAVEVKTTRSPTARRVTIHGEEQLEPPTGGALHLHFVRVEVVPGAGRSVTDLVDELLGRGVSASELYDALDAAGVPAADLATAAETTFEVGERLTFLIDESFPRIVSGTFAGGVRPQGVLELSYVVDLDHMLEASLGNTGYERVIESLAGAKA